MNLLIAIKGSSGFFQLRYITRERVIAFASVLLIYGQAPPRLFIAFKHRKSAHCARSDTRWRFETRIYDTIVSAISFNQLIERKLSSFFIDRFIWKCFCFYFSMFHWTLKVTTNTRADNCYHLIRFVTRLGKFSSAGWKRGTCHLAGVRDNEI